MKKILFSMLALVFASAVLTGCRAEVDPDGDVTSGIALPR